MYVAYGAGVSVLAALIISGCIAAAAAEDLSFASVPTSHDVAQAVLPKLAECLIDCAANPSNVLLAGGKGLKFPGLYC